MSSEDNKPVEGQQNDEWIVQAKTRRLVPQHSLSRQDLEADKNKVPVSDAAKKKGFYCAFLQYSDFFCKVHSNFTVLLQ